VGKAFAERHGVIIGSPLYLSTSTSDGLSLKVTGIFTSGSSEDDAVVTSLSIVQQYIGKSGQYRKFVCKCADEAGGRLCAGGIRRR